MRGRRHKLQVSTFPFLAVLLCAMGALILVLLVMDRKAHQAAQARARREAARLVEESARNETARQSEIERKKAEARAEWERKRDALHAKLTNEQIEMQLQMKKVRDQLREIAARLHYEQDTTTELRHKIQDERGRLEAERQLLLSVRSQSEQRQGQSKEANKTLQRMTLDVLQMEQALKDLKAARQREQKTFSVVPYHGRRGENRRPIYVECTGAGVIFHPDRREMSVNALALERGFEVSSDVRSEVERRIARQRAKLTSLPGKQDTTPYLLLLLRPAGVTTYHLLQATLKGLPLDFGYEFIDDDWILDFPAEDDAASVQPWMTAAKSATPPSSPMPPAATGSRPVGLPSITNAVAGRSVSPGFRAGEFPANGNWVRGGAPNTGEPGYVSTRSSPSEPGRVGALSANLENGAHGSLTQPRSPGDATGAIGRGTGRGHPAALAPSFGDGTGSAILSGDGPPPAGGLTGSGEFSLRGSGSGTGTGTGGSPSGTGAGFGTGGAGLGPPQALSFSGGGKRGGGSLIPGSPSDGSPGGTGGGTGTGTVGGSGTSGGTGTGTVGGSGTGAGTGSVGGSGTSGGTGTSVGGSGSGSPSQLTGQSEVGGSPNSSMASSAGQASPGGATTSTNANALDPEVQAALRQYSDGRGKAGAPSGGTLVIGGSPNTGQNPEKPTDAKPSGSPSVVIVIDPLTGKPTTAPLPAEPPADAASREERNNNEPRPRVRVIAAGQSGEPSDPDTAALNRYAPPAPPEPSSLKRKPVALKPAWVHGGRDWTIFVECRADSLVLYPSQRAYSTAQAASGDAGNPLVAAIRQMIGRRQATRRANEPPYRPQVCLLVRPDNVRTFLRTYRALEVLPVPITRRNLDYEDDVISIVLSGNP